MFTSGFPAIVVGIVVFNTEIDSLRRTFESIKGSSVPVKLVCLCNSPQPSYQLAVRNLAEEFEVELIANSPNRGFGAGHNMIWQSTNCDWYICCNPDIEADRFAIEHLVQFGEQQQQSCLLMPKVLNLDGSVQPLARPHPTLLQWTKRQLWRVFPRILSPFELTFDYSHSQPVQFVTGCFFAARKSLLMELRGFDEAYFLYAEDADLSRRAEAYGNNWYVASAIVKHAWASDWKRNHRAFRLALLGLLKYWRKFGFFS
jgi:GT2 family glycosyltransferase